MPPVPPDQRSPHPMSARGAPIASAATPTSGPRQRYGDRSSSDDDDAPLERWIRYADLKRAGIVGNWTQLLRLIELQNFPPGTMLSPKVRAWAVSEIEEWLATRPPAGKHQDADAVEAQAR
jgi:Prophage CP4-57 regulatory protein (AlpA)